MKTLRLLTLLVLTAVTILPSWDDVWAAPPEAFLSEAEANGQVSGNLPSSSSRPNSRAGLMTLQGLAGRNELTYGALPSVGLWGNWGDNYYNNQDYYTLDAFLPWNNQPGTDYFFSQLGITFTENGRLAGSTGMGYAYYLSDWDRLLRSSAWFVVDGQFDKTRTAFAYRAENLGKYVDFRAGIQVVASDSEDFVGRVFTDSGTFTGNQFRRNGYDLFETAYHNADVEVGGPLAYLGDYGISAYLRGYYLFNTQNDDDAVGVGVRGEWSITEDVTFNVTHTQDDIFDDSTWFNLILTTPDGAPRNVGRPISVRERFSKRVYHDGRIPTRVQRTPINIAAVNGKSGNAFNFLWVDPNRPTNGTGTRENPYNTLEAARLANTAGVDVIAVIPDTTNGDPGINLAVTQSFQLFNDQYFLGTSVDHMIPTANMGNILLPGSGGDGPFISNSSDVPGSVVTLANWNTVSGFIIDGRDENGDIIHDGIVGPGISGFDINRNTIQNVVNGTLITHMGNDVGYFDDNIVTGGGNNSTRGFSITHTSGTLDLSVQRNLVTGFVGEDLDCNAMLDLGVGIEIIAETASTINAWDPMVLGAPDPVPPEVLPDPVFGILDNVSTGNGTGFVLQANSGATINADIQRNDFSDNETPNTGARIEAFGGTVNLLAFNENTIDNNFGNGLIMHADAGLINIYEMQLNSISGNGVSTVENAFGTNNNGWYLLAENGSTIIADDSLPLFGPFDLEGQGIFDNTIDSNAGAGLFGQVDNSTVSLAFESGMIGGTFNGNGRDGLFFEADNAADIDLTMYNHTLNNNGGVGFGGDLFGASVLSFQVGESLAGRGNVINNNVGAGIGIRAFEGSLITNSTIIGNFIQSNNDDGDAMTAFGGDGIAILLDQSRLDNTQIDLNIIGDLMDAGAGNDGHGILVTTTGATNNGVFNLGIFNLLIGNDDGDNDNGNQIGNNGLDGVHIERSVASLVDPVRIIDNKIWNNGSDGIEIITRGSNTGDAMFDIFENWILGNTANGINLQVVADANMDADILNNIIDMNGANGILTTESTNTINDERGIDGTWAGNVIINNGLNGISTSASLDGLFVTANLIQANGLNGILHNSTGIASYDNNRVIGNGVNNVVGQNHGMDIQGNVFKRVILSNNLFDANSGDGLEINNSTGSFIDFEVFSTNDTFSNNGGRGIDILNQGNADTEIRFSNATVINNLLEGVYVVNTASTTQGQDVASTVALNSDGNEEVEPYLFFQFDGGRVEGNGVNSGFSTTGMVIRVGTSNQSGNGFASSFNSGVDAFVTNNIMQGNQGDDFYVEGFISTVTPDNSPALDPLARLDLTFRGNSGDSIDIDPGNFVVFYDNSSVPKSPWDVTRRRNATRLADNGFMWFGRVDDTTPMADEFDVEDAFINNFFNGANDSFNGEPLTFTEGPNDTLTRNITDSTAAGTFDVAAFPVAPNNGDDFFVDFGAEFFPGLGDSTFRVNADAEVTNFFNGTENAFFGTFGDIRPGIDRQGELDSIWGILP